MKPFEYVVIGILLVSTIILLWLQWARADVVITNDGGGNIGEYGNYYAELRESGEKVIVDGYCGSSCTMVLSVNYCVTPRAVLGFHKAYYRSWWNLWLFKVADPVDTAYLWSAYPRKVRDWINANGGLTYDLKLLRGQPMLDILKVCP